MNYSDLFVEYEFPKPLNKTELYDCFAKYKSGDKSAREVIIKHNIRLVLNQVIRKFSNTPYDKKDLISIGIIGLIKSVDTFDTSRNLQFTTYSAKCIDNEILMFIRKNKKHINDDSLDRILCTDKNGNKLRIEDRLYDENSDFISDYEDKELYDSIHRIIESFPERDKKIIMLYFGFIDNQPLNQKQIADKLNICQSSVSKIIKKYLKIISLQLNNEGIIETALNNTTKCELSKDKTSKKEKTIKGITENEVIIPEITREEAVKEQYNSAPWEKMIKEEKSINSSEIRKEDYIKLLELLKSPNFSQLMLELSPAEAIIVSLKLGYLDGNCFSTETIANFLNIEPETIIETTKRFLLAYKSNINQSIDSDTQESTIHTALNRKKCIKDTKRFINN